MDEYSRDVPPEVKSGEPYDPFKLDVWQLGTGISDFKVDICSDMRTSVTDGIGTDNHTGY